jgi:hypothetical protein
MPGTAALGQRRARKLPQLPKDPLDIVFRGFKHKTSTAGGGKYYLFREIQSKLHLFWEIF